MSRCIRTGWKTEKRAGPTEARYDATTEIERPGERDVSLLLDNVVAPNGWHVAGSDGAGAVAENEY